MVLEGVFGSDPVSVPLEFLFQGKFLASFSNGHLQIPAIHSLGKDFGPLCFDGVPGSMGAWVPKDLSWVSWG